MNSLAWQKPSKTTQSLKTSPFFLQVIERDDAGAVSRLEGVTHLEGNFKTTKWKLTWLAKSEELIPLTLADFDHLLTKKKLEDDDEILDLITPCSVSSITPANALEPTVEKEHILRFYAKAVPQYLSAMISSKRPCFCTKRRRT